MLLIAVKRYGTADGETGETPTSSVSKQRRGSGGPDPTCRKHTCDILSDLSCRPGHFRSMEGCVFRLARKRRLLLFPGGHDTRLQAGE